MAFIKPDKFVTYKEKAVITNYGFYRILLEYKL